MNFHKAVEHFYQKLGTHKIMAIASGANEKITVRNISAIIEEDKILFKTDKNFYKTKIMLENPNVALCVGGVQIEGTIVNHGLVVEQPDQNFQKLYEKYWKTSYNAYPHEDSEILIEVLPDFVEIWDQHENNHGFQILIDFEQQTAQQKEYD